VVWFKVFNCHQLPDPSATLIAGVPLSVVSKQHYLLNFNDQLKWSFHVEKVCKSMSYYLYLLNKCHHVIKADLLKTFIESLVLSLLLYSLPVWGPPLRRYSFQRLQQMQNCAVCLCKGLCKYDHVSHRYPALNWLPIKFLVQHTRTTSLSFSAHNWSHLLYLDIHKHMMPQDRYFFFALKPHNR